MSHQPSPIVVAAGGTGGHIYPAMAVATVLGERQRPVIWVGTQRGLEARVIPAAGIDIRWITVVGMRGKGVLGTVIAPFKLVYACIQSIGILARVRPGAVLGMGGFVAGPVGIASLLMRKPLILHEQNAVAGMTNRWLSRFANRVFSAMPNVFPAKRHAEVVGNPVRRDIAGLASRHMDQISAQGSIQGSIQESTQESGQESIQKSTRTDDLARVQSAYASLDVHAGPLQGSQLTALEFIDDMAARYAWADLVISRAGAMTVTELSAVGVASILVPFPHAVDDHQTLNARYLSDANAAILMPQDSLDADSLAARLTALHNDRATLNRMATSAGELFKSDAAERVADALIEVAG